MFAQLQACLLEQHDPSLVALAVVICGFTTYTAFSLAQRARAAAPTTQVNWIVAAAIALGSGVWTTHFIAMLGYRPHQHAGYLLWPTLLSIALAIFIASLGLLLCLHARRWGNLAGGALIGIGIGAMHYTGMLALQGETLSYDARLVALSLLVGIGLGALATHIGLDRDDHRGRLRAAMVLSLGIAGLHFIGMASLSIGGGAGTVSGSAQTMPIGLLATAITSVTLLVLALGLGGAIVDENLTRRRARDTATLQASETRFRQLANATFEGIVFHENGVIRDANDQFCELLGAPLEKLIGTRGIDHVVDTWQSVITQHLRDDQSEPMEIEMRRADGEVIPVEVLARNPLGVASNLRVVALRDLREQKEALDRIHHLAHHDALTGLANRKLFLDRLHQAMQFAQRGDNRVAVLCLDLDRFKNVNDLLGHWGGDELLRQVADRLSQMLRGQDTLARLGGDEFAIVQVGTTAPGGTAALAERLVKAMAEPFQLGEQQVLIGTSIGVALYPGDGLVGADLLRAADTALYRAKEDGRNNFRFFEAAMDVRLQERALLEHDLRSALANDQLEVHYQPLVDCHDGEVTGYEALVRWNHPLRGAISPADFIPLAEESGLILPLGHWVLRTACAMAMQWPSDLKVAVNLSPAQFRHGDLAGDVLDVLAQTGLAAPRLEIEITEGVLITDTDATLRILNQLKQAGVRIALDDFGTGYSSLSYLQRFPFDKIKIDRSFVWQMQQNRESMSIVRAVIALGHSLHITVTAEGVETPEQLSLLQHERCDQVQGYLLGRPAAQPPLPTESRNLLAG